VLPLLTITTHVTMRFTLYTLTLSIIFAALGCKPDPLKLKGIDNTAWTNDKKGCNDIRKNMLPAFLEIKDSLIGHSEEDIMATFGHPDRIEVYPRGQRFFLYFTQKGDQCNGTEGTGKPLQLRFNATDHLTEITY
jgi:hypothetical protein